MTKPMWDDETGKPITNPSDLDYRKVDICDYCKTNGPGWMYHAAGATGRVCAVLFIGDCCKGGPK